MPFVSPEAIKMFENGATWQDVFEARVTSIKGEPAAPRTCRRWHKYWREGIADPASGSAGIEEEVTDEEMGAIFRLIKDNPMSAKEISEEIDRSESSVQYIVQRMQEAGYNILREQRQVQISTRHSVLDADYIPKPLLETHRFRFGVISDTHAGSKEEQITHCRHFLAYARKEGVEVFLHAGDLTAGYSVYRGQELDVYASSSDAQLAAAERALTIQPNETWLILGGNHDFSHLKNGGTDPIWRFCRKHSNAYFLGYDEADVYLIPGFGVRLWHPSGGTPYAKSYRLQKGMESLAYEQLFTLTTEVAQQNSDSSNGLIKVLIAGHLHVDAKVHTGGVLGLQAACFEGKTNYLKRKQLHPQIGGYIVELTLDEIGNIVRSNIDHRVYVPIEEDYKNYDPIHVHTPDVVEEIFVGNGALFS